MLSWWLGCWQQFGGLTVGACGLRCWVLVNSGVVSFRFGEFGFLWFVVYFIVA